MLDQAFEKLVEAAEEVSRLIAGDDAVYERWVHEADALEDALKTVRSIPWTRREKTGMTRREEILVDAIRNLWDLNWLLSEVLLDGADVRVRVKQYLTTLGESLFQLYQVRVKADKEG